MGLVIGWLVHWLVGSLVDWLISPLVGSQLAIVGCCLFGDMNVFSDECLMRVFNWWACVCCVHCLGSGRRLVDVLWICPRDIFDGC